MNNLTSENQALLAIWQQHTYAEFVRKDADATLATMTETPYILMIPCGVGAVGKAEVRDFYANQLIPYLPPDLDFTLVSQIFAHDCIVEESVARFTHSLPMDWAIPGVPPTGRKVELVMVGIIRFANGKVASEHLYWDQAAVLAQLGLVNIPVAAAGMTSAAKLLKLTT